MKGKWLIIALGVVLGIGIVVQGAFASPGVGWWKNHPESWPTSGVIVLGTNSYDLSVPAERETLSRPVGEKMNDPIWMIGHASWPGKCVGCHGITEWHIYNEFTQGRSILAEKIVTAQFTLLEAGIDSFPDFIMNANEVYKDSQSTRAELIAQASLVETGLRQALQRP